MHQYASECIKMYHNVCWMNYFNVLCMKFLFEKFQFFWLKMTNFFSKCSECINMHQNASKCMQNELCKCFVHEIIKQVVFITYRLVKLTIFHAKIGYFVPSAQNASICIRMHQNVCRMKCANVLCTKISKIGFILHLKGLKSAKYICHFVMENPVWYFVKFLKF